MKKSLIVYPENEKQLTVLKKLLMSLEISFKEYPNNDFKNAYEIKKDSSLKSK